MLKASQILVSVVGLVALGVGLAGCGQRGPLFLPNDTAAANRATLPQTLLPIPPRDATTVVVPDQTNSTPKPSSTTTPANSGAAGNATPNNNPAGNTR